MSYFLFDSVKKNNLSKLKKILEKGKKSPNVVDSKGTPLHFSAWQGHLDICKYLVEKGADVNASNKKWKKTPLILAAYAGKADVVNYLISKGSDVNARDESEWSPLHFAAQEGHEECVRALLIAKADTTIRNNEGKTAKEVAEEECLALFDNPPGPSEAPEPEPVVPEEVVQVVEEKKPETKAPPRPAAPSRPVVEKKKPVVRPPTKPVSRNPVVQSSAPVVATVDIKDDLNDFVTTIKGELSTITSQIISNLSGKIDNIEIPAQGGGGGGGNSEEVARLVGIKLDDLISTHEAEKTKLREEIEELKDEKMELEGKFKELKERLASIISDI